jgi:hypothetical protein
VYEFGDNTACFLYPTPNAGTSQASQAFWQVEDVEREVAELKARGVKFEEYDLPGEKSPSGVLTAGGAKAAWFRTLRETSWRLLRARSPATLSSCSSCADSQYGLLAAPCALLTPP